MSDERQPEEAFFSLLGRDFEQILGQIVSIRVKTLSNTNLAASRHIKREKNSFPVDMRRSKTSLLKFPYLVTLYIYISVNNRIRFPQQGVLAV